MHLGPDQLARRIRRAAGRELADEEIDGRKRRIRVKRREAAVVSSNRILDCARRVDARCVGANRGKEPRASAHRGRDVSGRYALADPRRVVRQAHPLRIGQRCAALESGRRPTLRDEQIDEAISAAQPGANEIVKSRRARTDVEVVVRVDASFVSGGKLGSGRRRARSS